MLRPHPINAEPPFESPNGWYYMEGFPKTFIEGSVSIQDNAVVKDTAKVFGYVILKDDAVVYGNATVKDSAVVGERAQVGGDAIVQDDVQLYGTTHVKGSANLKGSNVQLYDNLIEK